MLFYSPEFREKKIAEPKAQVSGQLSLIMDAPDGWLDRVVQPRDLPAIPLTLQVPNYLPGALLSGDVVRVRVGAAVGGAPVK